MTTEGHTREHPTAPTLTTIITREICRTCADRAPKSTSDTPGRSDYRSPSRDQSSSRRHHRCQTEISAPEKAASANYAAKMPQTTRRRCRHPLVSRLWPAPRRCPQGGRRREGAFIARSRRSEVSLRSQGRGEGGGAPHNSNASKKEHDAHGRRRRRIRQRPDIEFLLEMLNHRKPKPARHQPPPNQHR